MFRPVTVLGALATILVAAAPGTLSAAGRRSPTEVAAAAVKALQAGDSEAFAALYGTSTAQGESDFTRIKPDGYHIASASYLGLFDASTGRPIPSTSADEEIARVADRGDLCAVVQPDSADAESLRAAMEQQAKRYGLDATPYEPYLSQCLSLGLRRNDAGDWEVARMRGSNGDWGSGASFYAAEERTKVGSALAEALLSAVEQYAVSQGRYPSSLTGTLPNNPKAVGKLFPYDDKDRFVEMELGAKLAFELRASEIRVTSWGADRMPGTADDIVFSRKLVPLDGSRHE